MTTYPSLRAEIDVTTADVLADPYSYVWTSLAGRIRNDAPVVIEQGMNPELGRIEPGRCVLTLDNRDRALDPRYAASPYYGKIVPMRPFRVVATYGGLDYVLFTGYTEAFRPKWGGEGGSRDHVVEVEARDVLDYLGRSPLGLEPFYTWVKPAGVLNTTLNVALTGGRAMSVRLQDDPGTVTYTIQVNGRAYGTNANIGEQFTLTTANYRDGVIGTKPFAVITSISASADNPGPIPAATVELNLLPTFISERSDVQIGWALDIAGWSAGARDSTPGKTTCTAWTAKLSGTGYQQSELADGDTVLSAIQRIVESEGGTFFVNGASQICYYDRQFRVLHRTPVATLGSGAGETPITLDTPPVLDTARLYNIVRITPADGGTQVASNAASITAYGRRPYAKGGLLLSRTEAQSRANAILSRGKTPRPRGPGGWIVGGDSTFATMLAATINQAYTLRQRPPNVGPLIEDLVYLDRISWEIRRGSWRCHWDFSEPALFWVLGDSTFSVLGSSTIAVY